MGNLGKLYLGWRYLRSRIRTFLFGNHIMPLTTVEITLTDPQGNIARRSMFQFDPVVDGGAEFVAQEIAAIAAKADKKPGGDQCVARVDGSVVATVELDHNEYRKLKKLLDKFWDDLEDIAGDKPRRDKLAADAKSKR